MPHTASWSSPGAAVVRIQAAASRGIATSRHLAGKRETTSTSSSSSSGCFLNVGFLRSIVRLGVDARMDVVGTKVGGLRKFGGKFASGASDSNALRRISLGIRKVLKIFFWTTAHRDGQSRYSSLFPYGSFGCLLMPFLTIKSVLFCCALTLTL